MNEEKVDKVIEVLALSDIVWPRYGSETIEELARKIVSKLEEKNSRFEYNGETD